MLIYPHFAYPTILLKDFFPGTSPPPHILIQVFIILDLYFLKFGGPFDLRIQGFIMPESAEAKTDVNAGALKKFSLNMYYLT